MCSIRFKINNEVIAMRIRQYPSLLAYKNSSDIQNTLQNNSFSKRYYFILQTCIMFKVFPKCSNNKRSNYKERYIPG